MISCDKLVILLPVRGRSRVEGSIMQVRKDIRLGDSRHRAGGMIDGEFEKTRSSLVCRRQWRPRFPLKHKGCC